MWYQVSAVECLLIIILYLATNRSSGVSWEYISEGDNSYYSTQLVYADKSDLVFSQMIDPPLDGSASICVKFKYKKYSLGRRMNITICLKKTKQFVFQLVTKVL